MDRVEDNLKWFGEGFDGFPKRLPEDCVEYSIFVIDHTPGDSSRRQRLREVQSASTSLCKRLLKDYIWQREGFCLELLKENGQSILRGRTVYGDSVEDEWLIVYLLRELSKQFPDTWTKVVDTDGEFLLIEAANTLPTWLNPEIADNRVWINNGRLRIIPPTHPTRLAKGESPASLTLEAAMSFLQGDRRKLLNPRLVEEEAFYRLRNYPRQIAENFHHSLISIPRKLAFVLHQNPAYVSPAVDAFYLRDPISMRSLRVESPAHLSFPPEDFVIARVKFTKVTYAQLKSQRFQRPSTWSDVGLSSSDATSLARAEMGMKLCCGFEMLLSDPHNQDKKPVREIKILLEDLASGEEELPNDAKVAEWGVEEDSEAWMDIDYEDFEQELSGRSKGKQGMAKGFGDKTAQENLQKMVARFEEFLNDDSADDMDNDDDDDDDDDDDASEGEDKDTSFNEDEFTTMMREMMGMPVEVMREIMHPSTEDGKARDLPTATASTRDAQVETASDDEEDEEEIKRLTEAMEAELKGAGALRLDPLPKELGRQPATARLKNGADASVVEELDEAHESDDEGPLDENFNLVKNMLESFKSQGGAAGPGGSLLGMMGMRLPRDEAEAETEADEGPSK